MKISFPAPPRELSPNARVHWAQRYRASQRYKEECGWTLLAAKQERHPTLPLRSPVVAKVTFVLPGRHRRDADNCMAMLKPLWDAMVETRWLEDDSHEHLVPDRPTFVHGPRAVIVELEGSDERKRQTAGSAGD